MDVLTDLTDLISGALPASEFQPLAATTSTGPHVTAQAGVVQSDRYWTTTSRHSLKAKAFRRRPFGGVVLHPEGPDGPAHVVTGRMTVLDARRPVHNLADPEAALWSGVAAARLAAMQARQVAGYVEAARKVPTGWLPMNRVLLSLRLTNRLVLDGHDLVTASGAWERRPKDLRAEKRRPGGTPDTALLPPALRRLVDQRHDSAWVGVVTDEGAVPLPATWDPAGGYATVARSALAAVHAAVPGPVCVMIEDARGRRPDQKHGVMLRGRGYLVDLEDHAATLQLITERITYWEGFQADTVAA